MQKRQNYYQDNQDLQFHVERRVNFELIYKLMAPEDRAALSVESAKDLKQMVIDFMNQVGEVSGTHIAPSAREVDRSHAELKKNGEVELPEVLQKSVRSLVDIGLSSVGVQHRFGGIPIPIVMELMLVEMIYRACPSTFLNVTWFSSIARVIDEFGTEDQKTRVIPKLASGEWSGNMALTEPDAGSDLGAIRTYGSKQSDGSYKLSGTKRFISNGNGMVSLVLAKTSVESTGLEGLSLFLCLRQNQNNSFNYAVTKIEEKPGLHGSATCELKFDGSRAELIGEEGRGFSYMLHLMNEARLAVGCQGLGIMEAVLRLSKDYASQRTTWGRPIDSHEMIHEMLLDMEVSTLGLRSLSIRAAQSLAISTMASKQLESADVPRDFDEGELKDLKAKHNRRVRRWTPIIKYYSGEMCVQHSRQSMQIHGGYGYTTEYSPEWWLRESLIIPVYEGTSQIQALMCMKDSLKEITKTPTRFIESALGTRVKMLSERNPLKRKLNKLRHEYDASLMSIIFKLLRDNVKSTLSDINPSHIRQVLKILPKELVKFDTLRPALLHAERVIQLKTMLCIGESLIHNAKVDPTREWIAERWLNTSIPKAAMLHAQIQYDEPVLTKRLSKIPPLTVS
jgi:alkylation response protein AidB-like acyl-CoA dehydrogenase